MHIVEKNMIKSLSPHPLPKATPGTVLPAMFPSALFPSSLVHLGEAGEENG